MIAVPDDSPDNKPVPLTVAIVIKLLLHVPPPVTSLKGIVAPAQITPLPLMTAGAGLTVKVFVTVHPDPKE